MYFEMECAGLNTPLDFTKKENTKSHKNTTGES